LRCATEYRSDRPLRGLRTTCVSWLDTSPYPASGCSDSFTPGNCLSDKALEEEVARAMKINGWTAGHSHLFFVFTSYGEGSCVFSRLIPGCASARYCAWHNFFHANGQTVIYASQPYPAGGYGRQKTSRPHSVPRRPEVLSVTRMSAGRLLEEGRVARSRTLDA
jgi:hypothetical protein